MSRAHGPVCILRQFWRHREKFLAFRYNSGSLCRINVCYLLAWHLRRLAFTNTAQINAPLHIPITLKQHDWLHALALTEQLHKTNKHHHHAQRHAHDFIVLSILPADGPSQCTSISPYDRTCSVLVISIHKISLLQRQNNVKGCSLKLLLHPIYKLPV